MKFRYIVDKNYELLKPALIHFPIQYQQRLRQHIIDEKVDGAIMEKIPNNQFGICLVYNYLNYRPLEIIKKYFIEIYQKLKPGGGLIMTFNDCDYPKAVELVERNFACYTPGTLVRELAQNIGFEIQSTWSDGGPSVWLELHKPGILTSLRGGQTLATIKDSQDLEFDVDFLARKVYTVDEVERMRVKARNFNVDEATILSLKPLELQDLINKLNVDYYQQLEQCRLEEIQRQKKAEKQRIKALHNHARSLGINPNKFSSENLLSLEISQEIDRRSKQEIVLLRQRAMELQVGDPNLVRYGYSAEKLKQLIKEKEEGQK
jgi:SAM-dependent methyltransferase